MKSNWNPFLLIGLIGLITAGSSLFVSMYRVFWGPDDIYWTPRNMMLSLEDTKGEFQLFIAGNPLKDIISEGRLMGLDSEGRSFNVVDRDIGVRLNNWDKARVTTLKISLLTSFMTGLAIAFLIAGIVQFYSQKKQA